jgi:Tfp pilus assembly protein PilF
VVSVTLAAYASSFTAGLVYDDHLMIEQDPRVTGPLDPTEIFTTVYWGEAINAGVYRPLTVLSFALNHAVAGARPGAYHLVNAILHAAAGAVLYILARSLFRSPPLALAAALIFAVHPVRTEAVTWIIGRAEVLACLLGLASMVLARRRVLLSLVCFALALLCKENAVVFLALTPASLLLHPERGSRPWLLLASMAGIVCLWFIARRMVTGSFLTPADYVPDFVVNPLAHVGAHERIGTALLCLGKYLRLLVLPVGLSGDYSFDQIPIQPGVLALPALLGAGLVLGMVGTSLLTRKRAPEISLGIAWILIAILPTSNLLFPIGTIFAERFLYLPSVGYCLVLGGVFLRGWRATKVTGVALGVLVVLFAVGTGVRNLDWKDDETFFASVIRTSPRSVKGLYELGVIRQRQGDLESSISLLTRATEIHPEYAEAHYALGGGLRLQGNLAAATGRYLRAIEIRPEYAEAHHNLGVCLYQMGSSDAAIESILESIRIYPYLEVAYLDLSAILVSTGDTSGAIEVLESLLEKMPGSAAGRLRLARIRERARTPKK